MALKTRKSDPNKPFRIMLYGQEGTGKTTFGANAPKPIFVSAEGGTDQIEGAEEIEGVESWETMLAAIRSLSKEKHSYQTVVLDSADWAEALAHKMILAGKPGKTITTVDGGYGAGYRRTQNLFQEMIEALNEVRDKGMNVVILAHAHVKAVKDPEMPHDYDQFEVKIHELASAVLREWVDMLGFVRFETFVKESEDTTKARANGTGERVLYVEKRPAFQAKNRYGMPESFPFTTTVWDDLMPYIKRGAQAPEEKPSVDLKSQIEELKTKIADKDLLKKIQVTIDGAGDDQKKLAAILSRLQTLTKTKGDA